jgi:hypothetical protein
MGQNFTHKRKIKMSDDRKTDPKDTNPAGKDPKGKAQGTAYGYARDDDPGNQRGKDAPKKP